MFPEQFILSWRWTNCISKESGRIQVFFIEGGGGGGGGLQPLLDMLKQFYS